MQKMWQPPIFSLSGTELFRYDKWAHYTRAAKHLMAASSVKVS
jgi:hypothetical protein